jgi:hypothetical protein
VLFAAAAVGALFRSAGSGLVGRTGGIVAAVALAGVGFGVYRGRKWALGSAFFLGLFWAWAAIALGVQDVMSPAEVVVWLAWSAVVMTGSVRVRTV